MAQYQLSDKSMKFIEDLTLYLFSSGKNNEEINEITDELKDHLYQAEQNGKSIEQIVGASPKEYMKGISSEMKTDYKAWAKYVPLIILGSMSYSIFGDLLKGTLNYSLLKIIGSIVYSLLFLGGVFFAFRYTARNQLSRKMEFVILLLPIMISMLFFGATIIADAIYQTPVIHFGVLGSLFIGLLFLCFVIYFSFWAKTAILPVTLLALHLPTFILSITLSSKELQLIIGMIVSYLIIGLYLLYLLKKEKKKETSQ
ncbi:DUF1129 family protein [Robertmurraya sp. P23]|uniref:DUF1129 family protein n=1 Tax=Robertmurraya sp. P23 TaxID=3436931 RepID=UPI003D97A79D